MKKEIQICEIHNDLERVLRELNPKISKKMHKLYLQARIELLAELQIISEKDEEILLFEYAL